MFSLLLRSASIVLTLQLVALPLQAVRAQEYAVTYVDATSDTATRELGSGGAASKGVRQQDVSSKVDRTSNAVSEGWSDSADSSTTTSRIVGTIAEDFLLPEPPLPAVEERDAAERKSVPLAAMLSALVPGAGQVYAEAPWWRTALYAGVEALAWTAYGVTSAKGSSLTREFEGYADEHWSVVRYIEWLSANYSRWPDSAVNKEAAADALRRIYTSTDATRAEWERVDFAELNRLERAIRGGFSHTLPAHGHQQYYEQIGKYVQYRAGWDDHASEGDTVIYDPARVTGRNLAYMEKRADANDYLGYASTALGGVLLNHLASLLDAALTARAFNATVRAELKGSLLPNPDEPLHVALALRVHF